MKNALLIVIAVFSGYNVCLGQNQSKTDQPTKTTAGAPSVDKRLAEAFAQRKSNIQVTGSGTVQKLLADDSDGSRHQRFILKLASGQTLLVAHNIDLAPRLSGLRVGDTVEFAGEYEWNKKGGVVHWTHRDPSGRHTTGWLMHRGKKYQ